MKPAEIYGLLSEFDKMWADHRFTTHAKVAMAREFMASLPPHSLATGSRNTLQATLEYMANVVQGALNEEAQRNTKQQVEKTESKPTEKASMDRKEQTPASDNKDEVGGRTKVGKTPSDAKKRRSKKQSA